MSQRERLQAWMAEKTNERLEKARKQREPEVSGPVHFLRYQWFGFGRDQMYRNITPPEFSRPRRPWVAKITGLHPVYGLAREFVNGYLDLSEANRSADKGVYLYFLIMENQLYEAHVPLSRKRQERRYLIHEGAEIRHLEREEAVAWTRTISG